MSGEQLVIELGREGLGNRLHTLASALCYAHRRGIPLARIFVSSARSNHHGSDNESWRAVFPTLQLAAGHAQEGTRPPVRKIVSHHAWRVVPRTTAVASGTWRAAGAEGSTTLWRGVTLQHPDMELLQTVLSKHATLPALPAGVDATDLADCVFLHVRRGDYAKGMYRHVLAMDLHAYYGEALRQAAEGHAGDLHVLVSTDDEAWCRAHLPARYPWVRRWSYSRGRRDTDALAIMAACGRGGVTSNSTFSWWAMVLAATLQPARPGRRFWGPFPFLRRQWPFIDLSLSARVLPAWCTAVVVPNELPWRTSLLQWAVARAVAAAAVCASCMGALLRQQWRRQQNKR